MRLLNRNSLVFNRRQSDTGYVDPETRLWVEGSPSITICARGSLQPLTGKSRRVLPEGITTSDSRVFYTRTPIFSAEEQLNQEADTTTIGGITYEVIKVEDWSNNNLTNDHFKCILVRKDKLGG